MIIFPEAQKYVILKFLEGHVIEVHYYPNRKHLTFNRLLKGLHKDYICMLRTTPKGIRKGIAIKRYLLLNRIQTPLDTLETKELSESLPSLHSTLNSTLMVILASII